MAPRRRYGLTERQFEVVWLTAQGLTNQDVATALEVNLQTVKNHLQMAYETNDVSNVRELIWKLGWVKPRR